MLGSAILYFIERYSLQRLNSTSIIEKEPQSVSFIEKSFSILCLYSKSPLLEVLLYMCTKSQQISCLFPLLRTGSSPGEICGRLSHQQPLRGVL